MSNPILAAAVQMSSTADKTSNLQQAEHWIEQAVKQGASLVVLPELFNCLASPEEMLAAAEDIPGPTSEAAHDWAKRWQITLLAGSMLERAGDGKAYNTSVVYGPSGELLKIYRKVHLFDVDLPGQVTFHESSFVKPGDRIETIDTACGRLGLSICYDLRFPELYRRLAEDGADVLAVPSAFALATGRDHWQVLLQARAIENQAFVIAANQHGKHSEAIVTYGRSMIIDPWGIPLSTASDGQGLALAPIDFANSKAVRARLPALSHRRQIEAWTR